MPLEILVAADEAQKIPLLKSTALVLLRRGLIEVYDPSDLTALTLTEAEAVLLVLFASAVFVISPVRVRDGSGIGTKDVAKDGVALAPPRMCPGSAEGEAVGDTIGVHRVDDAASDCAG